MNEASLACYCAYVCSQLVIWWS